MKQPVRIALALTPLVALVALVALFALNLNRDPSLVASVMINKPVPQFSLPAVAGLPQPGPILVPPAMDVAICSR